MITSGILGGVMVSILTWNARDVGSIPALCTIFPVFITPTTLVAVTMNLYKLHAVWFLNLPCELTVYGHCIDVYNLSIERLIIPRALV